MMTMRRSDSSKSVASTKSFSSSATATDHLSLAADDDNEYNFQEPPSPPPRHGWLLTVGKLGVPFVEEYPSEKAGCSIERHAADFCHERPQDVSCCCFALERCVAHATRFWQGRHAIKVLVLVVLCLQNSLFTVLRRYSQGVLQETASKYEVLLVGEVIKILFSAWMIKGGLGAASGASSSWMELRQHLRYITGQSGKMVVLAVIYGVMNILSFVALRHIGAGLFCIFAQCKILTTAAFSTLLLGKRYSATKWRALLGLVFGVLLFSEPLWRDELQRFLDTSSGALLIGSSSSDPMMMEAESESPSTRVAASMQRTIGIVAVLTEVTLSGFASIYFEKVIKTDNLKLNIWERNFQLALASFPVYLVFIAADAATASGGDYVLGSGWSCLTGLVAVLGAAGGLLVALSIKYGDAILKTLATTGAIVLSSVLDRLFLGGPLTPIMCIAGVQVILAIFDYSLDPTPASKRDSNDAGRSQSLSPQKHATAMTRRKSDRNIPHLDLLHDEETGSSRPTPNIKSV